MIGTTTITTKLTQLKIDLVITESIFKDGVLW